MRIAGICFISSVSDIVRQNAIAAGVDRTEKFCTIYSSMELDWVLSAAGDPKRVREEFGIPLEAPVVGRVARLFDLKGHDQLFDAASEIVRGNPDVRFFLRRRNALRASAAARGADGHPRISCSPGSCRGSG